MSRPTVAIIGASSDRSKFGNKSLRAHDGMGYQVFPVNPKGGEIEGFPVYQTIGEVPVDHLNRVSMYVPPSVGLKLLDEIAAKGCDELWLNPGSESDALVTKARELGLEPVVACSIVSLGVSPRQIED